MKQDLGPRLSVIVGRGSLVSHTGGVLLVETARRRGLVGQLSRLLGWCRPPSATHDPAKVVALCQQRQQAVPAVNAEEVFGPVLIVPPHGRENEAVGVAGKRHRQPPNLGPAQRGASRCQGGTKLRLSAESEDVGQFGGGLVDEIDDHVLLFVVKAEGPAGRGTSAVARASRIASTTRRRARSARM